MHRLNDAGQALLIAVLIGLILLISIPVVVFINQIGSLHQTASQKRTKGRQIAEEGISYAIRQLSQSSTTWNAALVQGKFDGSVAGSAPTDCNTGNLVSTPSGGQFKLFCSTGTIGNVNIQPYEVAVTAVAYFLDTNTALPVPMRAIKAYLGQRTLGVDLATGVHAGAALVLVSTPTYQLPIASPPDPLVINWGPMVILDTHTTTLNGVMNQATDGEVTFPGNPRKFSLGGITGPGGPNYVRVPDTSASAATTDQKEYCAFSSISFPPLIDSSTYMAFAKNENPALFTGGPTSCAPACIVNQQGLYFSPSVPVSTMTFLNPQAAANAVIFIDGNAVFNMPDGAPVLDVAPTGGIIVTGSLTLGTSGGGSSVMTLHIPPTAPLEYPYWQLTGAQWPCENQYFPNGADGTTTCTTDQANQGNINIRGFLDVMNNLIVADGNTWVVDGGVMVGDVQNRGGQLNINIGASLNILYEDAIVHNILMNPVAGQAIQVSTDFFQDVLTP